MKFFHLAHFQVHLTLFVLFVKIVKCTCDHCSIGHAWTGPHRCIRIVPVSYLTFAMPNYIFHNQIAQQTIPQNRRKFVKLFSSKIVCAQRGCILPFDVVADMPVCVCLSVSQLICQRTYCVVAINCISVGPLIISLQL